MFLLVAQTNLYSQNNLFSEYEEFILNRNQAQFTVPHGFVFKEDQNQKFNCLISDQYRGFRPPHPYSVESTDGHFLVFIDVAPIYSKDSVNVYVEFNPASNYKINNAHIYHVLGDFLKNTTIRYGSLRECPIRYQNTLSTDNTFNADTVIRYSLKIINKDPLRTNYNQCEVMVLQKNGRGYTTLYCFYKNGAKRNLDLYFKSIDKMFRYRDPKEFIEVSEWKSLPKNTEIKIGSSSKNPSCF